MKHPENIQIMLYTLKNKKLIVISEFNDGGKP